MRFDKRKLFTSAMIVACIGLSTVMPQSALAHGPLHEQIALLTEQIKHNPNDAALYMKRGELYRHHHDWQAALTDFDMAIKLDSELVEVDLARGKTMFAAGKYQEAKAPLDRFLIGYPRHPEALVTRARVLVQLDLPLAAAKDYTLAISLFSKPLPEYYLERAQALTTAGPEYFNEVLRGLDQGMDKLGPVVTIQLYAIELEVELERYEAALARIDQLAANSPRKAKWLMRRGEILQKANRYADARDAYKAALDEIYALPSHHQHTQFNTNLRDYLLRALEGIEDR